MSPKQLMVDEANALKGRPFAIPVPPRHVVLGNPLVGPFPDGLEQAGFAMGCFWGAERLFWQIDGVYTTAVGYCGGFTVNPTYEEVCSSKTGHAETVLVVFDPKRVSFAALLKTFFEGHDPTQYMRQGNDVGTQYRSAIYVTTPAQREEAIATLAAYGERLAQAGFSAATTEVEDLAHFYYAEDYHQQYLAVNPYGYCGLSSTGVACPTGLVLPDSGA